MKHNMKKIILLFFIVPLFVNAQRVRDLSTQSTYDASMYILVDKAGLTAAKKMQLSVLTGTESNARKSADTITRRGVGLTDAGNYKTDESTHYLKNATMSCYDTISAMTALHILDSVLYGTGSLWEVGKVATAVEQGIGNDTAVGAYSVAMNYQTISKKGYSVAMGYRGVSDYETSLTIGGGSSLTKYGANQASLFVGRCESKTGAADTIEVNKNFPLSIPTDAVIGFKVVIVGVQSSGGDGSTGDAMFQEWSGVIRNDAGTTALIGTVDSTTAKRSNIGVGIVAVTADNTNDQLNIICNASGDRTWQWTAYIRFIYAGYRNFNLGY